MLWMLMMTREDLDLNGRSGQLIYSIAHDHLAFFCHSTCHPLKLFSTPESCQMADRGPLISKWNAYNGDRQLKGH